MLDLVRKRHEGDGWLVFTELANAPGFGAKRYADAFALGVWQSTNYEGHLYEFKASRGDLRRELGGNRECSCSSNRSWKRDCQCGAIPLSEVERKLAADVEISSKAAPADRHDDQGSGVDRRDAGPPEQDAGVELRDQRHEVPHGQ